MEEEDRKRLNWIVALAKAAYNTLVTITDNSNTPTITQIASRLHWIICHTDQWKHVCSSNYNGRPNYTGMKHAVEHALLVLEAATQPPELWRLQVKKVVGSTEMSNALDKANESLDTVLEELQADPRSFTTIDNEGDGTNKSVQEMLEIFGSTTSTADSNLINQQKLNRSLAAVLQETSEVRLADPIPDKMETLKFQVKLDQEVELGEILGEGVFAKVYAGTYQKKPFKKKEVAIKCIKVHIKTLPKKKILQVLF